MDELKRCDVTGNPCGTDTRPVGSPCQCGTCLEDEMADNGKMSEDPKWAATCGTPEDEGVWRTSDLDRLDRLMAEKCMGWRVHFRNTAHYVLAAQHGTTYDAPQAGVRGWHPSQNIAQAFMCVEAMREKSLWLVLVYEAGKHPQWKACFNFGGMSVGGRMRGLVFVATPALAICRAAEAALKDMASPPV